MVGGLTVLVGGSGILGAAAVELQGNYLQMA